MISAWHLFWIVTAAAFFGAATMAVFEVGDCDPAWFDDDHDVSGLLEED